MFSGGLRQTIYTDDSNAVVSRHFHKQICEREDLDKIRMPIVTHNMEETDSRYRLMPSIYEGIMPVKKTGQTHVWFTPWDFLIHWWGIEEAMTDMYDRPELVHAAVFDQLVMGFGGGDHAAVQDVNPLAAHGRAPVSSCLQSR